MKNFHIIVGVSKNNGIGFKGTIPWHVPEDLKYFKYVTTVVSNPNKQNAIIMGRNTFESIKEKPLKNRLNIVITSKKYDNITTFNSLNEAIVFLQNKDDIENIFVIGGQTLYTEALLHPNCEDIYFNIINIDVECDTFFPEIDNNIYKEVWRTEKTEDLEFCVYKNKKFIKH